MLVISLARIGAVAGCIQLASAAPFDFGTLFDNFFVHERGRSHTDHSSQRGSFFKTTKTSSSSSSQTSSSASTTVVAAENAEATAAAVIIDGSCANTASTRQCWGGGYYIGTDAETSWPNTGVIRTYTLEVTNITMAPDGTERQVFAINGQYPGPTIEAGETILDQSSIDLF